MEYSFSEIEEWVKQFWKQHDVYRTENNTSKPKYFVLDMFPYPSGAGLHVGHPLGYIASDIYARYKRLSGFNVLHPMGFDSFGLPAEQYAIQTGQHPALTTEKNIQTFKEQMDKIGFSFDWSREFKTSDPDFYKWTQWIFIKFFHSWYNKKTDKAEPIETLIAEFEKNGNENVDAACGDLSNQQNGWDGIFSFDEWNAFSEKQRSDILLNYRIAYLADSWVNWCPALGTVLANDEVKDGVSERGGYPVERKLMKQWSLRITAYAERLLQGLEKIEWSEAIKETQRNWIGRSEGCSVTFEVKSATHSPLLRRGAGGEEEEAAKDNIDSSPEEREGEDFSHEKFSIQVFTTRPDTIFGVTFITLAPEHELVSKIASPEYKQQVKEYVEYAKNRSERDRMTDIKKITGQFTGAYAIHPFSGKEIPIWIGEYVLASYGTGAVMGVPGHDERDHRFAKHFDLQVISIIEGVDVSEKAHEAKNGILCNSDFLNGLEVSAALKKAIDEIEELQIGKRKVNYKLRDAIFGRQRYWGEPIPVYYNEEGIPKTIDESDLPLILPEVDKYLPTEDGEPPLARAKDWKYHGKYEYELTTMPGWAGSNWYYLRYGDPHNQKELASKESISYWQNIDLYVGGDEHATGHLLYFRFCTKFLFDLGIIPFDEPAKKLVNQGKLQAATHSVMVVSNRKENERFIQVGSLSEGVLAIKHSNGTVLEFQKPAKNIFVSYEVDRFNPIPPRIGVSLLHTNYVPFESVDPFSETNDGLYDIEIDKFLSAQPELANSLFITENGCYQGDVFFPFYENAQHNKFKVKFIAFEKMSKSKLNVVNPNNVVKSYGADCFRLYEMFLGPLEQSKPWDTKGIDGVFRFLKKIWKLFYDEEGKFIVTDEAPSKDELKILHRTIKKAGDDIEAMSFNTSVSAFMICVNELTTLNCHRKKILEPLLIILSPFAPFISEFLWQKAGNTTSITQTSFPKYDESLLVEKSFEYPVAVNGKTRMKMNFDLNLAPEQIEKEVLSADQLQKYFDGKTPKKVIVVKGKMINVVI